MRSDNRGPNAQVRLGVKVGDCAASARVGDLRALDQRYGREDFDAGWGDESFAAAVMIMVTIKRWIAWADRE